MKNLLMNIRENRKEYFFWTVTLVLVIFPFFMVKYVPSTDLPQHLCQVKLFIEIFKNPLDMQDYFINWSGANSLVYILLGINWLVFSPIVAGKILMLELVLAWIVTIFILAKRYNAPIESAVLASMFVFNISFYWGLVNFLIGFPVFIAWYYYIIDREIESKPVKRIFLVILFTVLLFMAHAIWLLMSLIFLAIESIRRRRKLRNIVYDVIGLIPIIIYSLIWYITFYKTRAEMGFNIDPHWLIVPYKRLYPEFLIGIYFLGGLRGALEVIIFIGICIWCFLALYTNRKELRNAINYKFLWLSGSLAIFVFLGPDQFVNTIFFASRWASISVIFLLLSLPLPKISPAYRLAIPLLLIVVFFLTTGLLWYEFENLENTGLTEALEAIPEKASVMGLDFVKESMIIRGRPFMQTFAYAQVLHKSKINFSFTEHQNGIVVTRKIPDWTPGLEWFAERVRGEDCGKFDYALIYTYDIFHEYITSPAVPVFEPVTTKGQWRLYKCRHDIKLKGYLFKEQK